MVVGVGHVFQPLSYPLSGAERKPRHRGNSGTCEASFHDTRGESPAWHQLFHVEHSCRLVLYSRQKNDYRRPNAAVFTTRTTKGPQDPRGR